MYGEKSLNNVDRCRCAIFNKSFETKNKKGPLLNKIKTFNSNGMPPCSKVLKQKILRTAYVSSMLKNSHKRELNNTLNPENFGWTSESDKMVINWYEGESTPLNIDDIIKTNESDDDDDMNISYCSSSDETEDESSYHI